MVMENAISGARTSARVPFWHDRATRGIIAQVVALAVVVLGFWYFYTNTAANLATRNIASGFGFLNQEAGFGIADPVLPYEPSDTYRWAIIVGLGNTVAISVVGIILTTIFGTLMGIARLSSNWLISRIVMAYIEVFRNTPLLLQLFVWYQVVTNAVPGPRQAIAFAGFSLSNRGFRFPLPSENPVWRYVLALLVVGVAAAYGWARYAGKRRERTGEGVPTVLPALALVLGLPILGWVAGGAPVAIDIPELKGFNFVGGGTLPPEAVALLIGLVAYTSAYVAEVVRAGIQSVPRGQGEAARALGLGGGTILRLVVLPQALRVIIPPITSEYMDFVKNSSLAVAIGFFDFVSVTNTTMNQTGQAIEGVALQMGVYLFVSLTISMLMNWYNAAMALKAR